MSNVLHLVQSAGDGIHIDADQILEENKSVWVSMVIAGFNEEGDLICAGTDGHERSIYLLERAKMLLLTQETERT